MKYEFITFSIMLVIFYINSLFLLDDPDIGYWLFPIITTYLSLPIIGFILKKEFFAGAIGNLKYSEENRHARLLSFVLSVVLLFGMFFVFNEFYLQ